MKRIVSSLSYANVTATLAVFLALGGTAVAARGPGWITSLDIKNNSVRSADIQTQGVRVADVTQAVRQLPKARATGADITGYEDMAPIVGATLPRSGYHVVVTEFTAHNTGGANDYLNCGFLVGTTNVPTAGASADPGASVDAMSVTVVRAQTPGEAVTFACQGSGATTYDLSNIAFTAFRLG